MLAHNGVDGPKPETSMNMTTNQAPPKQYPDIADMPFEKALKELETIVGRLERGDVELEESIAIYERGEALKEHCDRLLKQAEAKVERLTFAADGTPKGTEPFDSER
jgi:exodeoxyribonuclease VII small subunit